MSEDCHDSDNGILRSRTCPIHLKPEVSDHPFEGLCCQECINNLLKAHPVVDGGSRRAAYTDAYIDLTRRPMPAWLLAVITAKTLTQQEIKEKDDEFLRSMGVAPL